MDHEYDNRLGIVALMGAATICWYRRGLRV